MRLKKLKNISRPGSKLPSSQVATSCPTSNDILVLDHVVVEANDTSTTFLGKARIRILRTQHPKPLRLLSPPPIFEWYMAHGYSSIKSFLFSDSTKRIAYFINQYIFVHLFYPPSTFSLAVLAFQKSTPYSTTQWDRRIQD
jgi:hypothetical protein